MLSYNYQIFRRVEMNNDIKASVILVVEDKEAHSSLVKHILHKSGYSHIITARTGMQALKIIENEKVDLVFLDCVVPDALEFDVGHKLSESARTLNIPIIMQTTPDKNDKKSKALSLGVSDFINKPIDESELLARTESQLKQKNLIKNLELARARFEQEFEEALKMMLSILPSSHLIAKISQKYNLSIDALFRPSSKIGGDFYDIIEYDDNKIGFYLWDFSGHGMGAAINTFRLHSIINTGQNCMVREAGAFLTSVNDILYNMLERQSYATMFYGMFDPKSMMLEYACASCPPPLLLSFKEKKYTLINSKEFPLGVINHHEYRGQTIDLRGWDAVVLYSDALIETADEHNKFLDIEELAQYLILHVKRNMSAKLLKEEIMGKFGKTRVDNLKDDLTFNILTFNNLPVA
jgi:sigma-B regulation protein RsbU (phosphoserine phosphatase)